MRPGLSAVASSTSAPKTADAFIRCARGVAAFGLFSVTTGGMEGSLLEPLQVGTWKDRDMTLQPDLIEDAVAAIARGGMIVVVDDEDRENEGVC